MTLPPLPSARKLTRQLRALRAAFAHPECGPEYVTLYCEGAGWPDAEWRVGGPSWTTADDAWPHAGREWLSASAPDDCVGIARRLLQAARDLPFTST